MPHRSTPMELPPVPELPRLQSISGLYALPRLPTLPSLQLLEEILERQAASQERVWRTRAIQSEPCGEIVMVQAVGGEIPGVRRRLYDGDCTPGR